MCWKKLLVMVLEQPHWIDSQAFKEYLHPSKRLGACVQYKTDVLRKHQPKT